jgi:GDP-L-fucose synthase
VTESIGRVFVAGAAGLTGANLLKRLLELGLDAAGSYHLSLPPAEIRERCSQFDFTRFDDCLRATKDQQSVVLCANSVAPAAAMRANPTNALLANLQITAGLLEACARNKVRKVVLISSSTVYAASSHPIRESDLDLNLQPYDLYRTVGWFHRYSEQLAMTYHSLKAFEAGIIRPTALFGPHDHFEAGRSQVLPANMVKAVEKQDPFVVWGDGKEVRDFHFIGDFIGDLLFVLERYCTADPVNSGSGQPRSIRDAISVILKTADHCVEPVYDATKPGAIPYRVLDISKLQSLCSTLSRTSFEDAVAASMDWHKANRAS